MNLINGNSNEELCYINDNSVDLVIIDPPYKIVGGGSGGCFGTEHREYHSQVSKNEVLNSGIDNAILDELVRVMKKINIYIWCNKNQLRQYIDYFDDLGCATDLLAWHKTNPVPTCNNKYLSDTEYLLYFREKGVQIYGTYETKKKWYVSPTNKEDKKLYGHPTIKPVSILENLIINSSKEGDTILDCFMGSGSTGVACVNTGREFIGIELDKKYYDTAFERIKQAEFEKEQQEKWGINPYQE